MPLTFQNIWWDNKIALSLYIYIIIYIYIVSYTVYTVPRCSELFAFSLSRPQPADFSMTQTSDDIWIHGTESLGTSMRETNMDSACSNSFQSLWAWRDSWRDHHNDKLMCKHHMSPTLQFDFWLQCNWANPKLRFRICFDTNFLYMNGLGCLLFWFMGSWNPHRFVWN
jgi:hypothetical protein